MSADPASLELLDRALAYTRGALASVTDAHLGRSTPCAGWNLRALLAHMDDTLDAFTEAASGQLALGATASADLYVARLQSKACALLGAWSAGSATGRSVSVGGLAVDTSLVVRAAALEITVHGWDVAMTTGHPRDVPEDLAVELLPVAGELVHEEDRGVRFAARRPARAGSGASSALIGFLGRP